MKWVKGQSGNPNGRPATEAYRKLRADLQAFLPEATEKLFEMVRMGDTVALALYFKMMVPPMKPASPPVEIPLKRGQSPTDAAETVVQLMLAGELSPTTGAEVLDALQSHRMLSDFQEVKEMLEEWRAERKAL